MKKGVVFYFGAILDVRNMMLISVLGNFEFF